MNMIKRSEKFPAIRCLCLANSGQGKTTFISNFIQQRIGKQWSAKRVIIISKTFKSDTSIAPLLEFCQKKKPNFLTTNCFDDVKQGISFVGQLLVGQKQIKEEFKKPINQWVILLDDLISERLLYDDEFIQLASLGRHYGISMITLLQETKTLSPKILGQCNLLIIGRLANQDRLEDLLQQFNEGLGDTKKKRREEIMRLFSTAISKAERGFLIIRPHEFDLKNRYLDLNWEPLIF